MWRTCILFSSTEKGGGEGEEEAVGGGEGRGGGRKQRIMWTFITCNGFAAVNKVDIMT